jgi:hypothetical protein
MRIRSRIGAPLAAVAVPVSAMFAIAIAVAGCGDGEPAARGSEGSGPAPLARQAPDAERTVDLVHLTTAQAARQAQRIALVVSRGSRVVEGAPGTPFTRTTFAVQDVLKGHLPREIVLQVIGGRLGDRVVDSPVPAFARLRRYVLFLGPDGPVGPTIFPQAVLDVKRAGATDVVEPAPRGIRLLGAGSRKPARALDAGPRLDDVLFSIRRYLRTNGGSR